jgi:tetratricopeptide (TPR) repeat protein
MRAELDRVMATMEREPRRFSRQLVTAWRLRADVAIDSGRHEEAESAAREALARAQAVHGARGQETLLAMRLLAEALRRNGKIDEAVSAAEQAFHVTVEAYAGRPLHPDLVQARGMYGRTLCDAGRMAEGLTQLSRAVEEAATLFGKESRSVGFLLQQLSGYQLRVGRILEALDSGSRAARIAATHAEPGSFTLAATLNNQARALLAARRGGEAVPLFDQVIAAAAKIFGATHPNTLAARADRALALAYAGNISDAARDIDLVTADMRKAGKPSARVLYAAGVIAPLAGAAPRALPLLGEARSILAGDRNARAELGQVEAQIGGIQAGREPGESEASLTAALALFKEVYQVDTPSHADANLALGRLRLAAGRAVEALPLLEQAGRFWDRFAPESRWAADASDTLARCYARLGRTADARLATARSRAVSARLDK